MNTYHGLYHFHGVNDNLVKIIKKTETRIRINKNKICNNSVTK